MDNLATHCSKWHTLHTAPETKGFFKSDSKQYIRQILEDTRQYYTHSDFYNGRRFFYCGFDKTVGQTSCEPRHDTDTVALVERLDANGRKRLVSAYPVCADWLNGHVCEGKKRREAKCKEERKRTGKENRYVKTKKMKLERRM